MTKLRKQAKKAFDACSKANGECQLLAKMIMPYIHEDIRDDISVLEQSADGMVMEFDYHNYAISDVLDAIEQGWRDIDMRDYYNCPFVAI